jgi:hypothetical protein
VSAEDASEERLILAARLVDAQQRRRELVAQLRELEAAPPRDGRGRVRLLWLIDQHVARYRERATAGDPYVAGQLQALRELTEQFDPAAAGWDEITPEQLAELVGPMTDPDDDPESLA